MDRVKEAVQGKMKNALKKVIKEALQKYPVIATINYQLDAKIFYHGGKDEPSNPGLSSLATSARLDPVPQGADVGKTPEDHECSGDCGSGVHDAAGSEEISPPVSEG
jgi:hypothetical protein